MSGITIYKELDEVRAPGDLPEVEVNAGDRGVVVEAFEHPRPAVMVEYADSEGRTKALVTYSPDLDQIINVIPETSRADL
jgi:hypothetical protein